MQYSAPCSSLLSDPIISFSQLLSFLQRVNENLKVLCEVIVLHGEVHGALDSLIAGVHYLPGQPIQGLLYIQIVVGVIQIVISKSYISFKITQNSTIYVLMSGLEKLGFRKKGGPYLRRRLERVFMCWAANQFFFGSRNVCRNEDIFPSPLSVYRPRSECAIGISSGRLVCSRRRIFWAEIYI